MDLFDPIYGCEAASNRRCQQMQAFWRLTVSTSSHSLRKSQPKIKVLPTFSRLFPAQPCPRELTTMSIKYYLALLTAVKRQSFEAGTPAATWSAKDLHSAEKGLTGITSPEHPPGRLQAELANRNAKRTSEN